MTQTKRFTVKFTNGYWKVFDTVEYTDVELHYLLREAVARATQLNK